MVRHHPWRRPIGFVLGMSAGALIATTLMHGFPSTRENWSDFGNAPLHEFDDDGNRDDDQDTSCRRVLESAVYEGLHAVCFFDQSDSWVARAQHEDLQRVEPLREVES